MVFKDNNCPFLSHSLLSFHEQLRCKVGVCATLLKYKNFVFVYLVLQPSTQLHCIITLPLLKLTSLSFYVSEGLQLDSCLRMSNIGICHVGIGVHYLYEANTIPHISVTSFSQTKSSLYQTAQQCPCQVLVVC